MPCVFCVNPCVHCGKAPISDKKLKIMDNEELYGNLFCDDSNEAFEDCSNHKPQIMISELTYYWFTETNQIKNSKGNEKIWKQHIRQPKMSFDKVLSLFNQDAVLTFHSFTCHDKKENAFEFPFISTDIPKNKAYKTGEIVFTMKEKISVLRGYLKEISFIVSFFSFTTSDGMKCYNNQNRFDYLEIDVEMPCSLKENFIRRVFAVDSGLGTILLESEKFPNSFLAFNLNKLIAIFPSVNNDDNSIFKMVQDKTSDVSWGLYKPRRPYPFTR